MKFDIEALKAIPIEDVLERLGAKKSRYNSWGKTFAMHCFCPMHQHGDKNPSLIIWKDKNICKCMVNPEVKGDPITIVKKFLFNGDFKEACIWLHENFNIPYLPDNNYGAFSKDYMSYDVNKIKQKHKLIKKTKKTSAPVKKEVKCLKVEDYKVVKNLKPFLSLYDKLNDAQKFKLIINFLYQKTLKNDKSKIIAYYKSRNIEIDKMKDVNYIGAINKEDIKELEEYLKNLFPIEDLIKFKILNPKDHKKRPLEFKYLTQESFSVVPSFDINNNLINALTLRSTKPYEWQTAKEFQLSEPQLVIPLPYPFNREDLNKSRVLITEGHIDLLSVKRFLKPSESDLAFMAIPGIYNAKREFLCLLKGKKVYISFDQDEAGQKGAENLKNLLKDYTKDILILKWDFKFGKDLNEVLQNGYMKYLVEKFFAN